MSSSRSVETAGDEWPGAKSPSLRESSGRADRARVLAGALHPDHRDLRKTFFKDRRFQLFPHFAHHVFAYRALPLAIAFETDFERHVKEDRLHLVTEALGHLDPLAALVNGK